MYASKAHIEQWFKENPSMEASGPCQLCGKHPAVWSKLWPPNRRTYCLSCHRIDYIQGGYKLNYIPLQEELDEFFPLKNKISLKKPDNSFIDFFLAIQDEDERP